MRCPPHRHQALRQGELLALGWDDVDLVAGRLMVRRSAEVQIARAIRSMYLGRSVAVRLQLAA